MSCERVLAAHPGLVGTVRGDAHLQLRPEPRAPGLARRFVLDQLPAGVAREDRELLLLLTSELVTNGVLHARTPLRLGVCLGDAAVLVTVEDEDLVLPEQQPYSDSRPSGRGMVLLAAGARSWGIERTEGGKVVWFSMGVHELEETG